MMLASGLGFGATGAISRSIEADVWQIASWRSLLGGGGVLAYVWLRSRIGGSPSGQRLRDRPRRQPPHTAASHPGGSPNRLRWNAALGPQGLVLVGLSGLSMILYIDALQRTEVANVAVISATVPFLAAGLAWLILRERLRRSTVVAAGAALGG